MHSLEPFAFAGSDEDAANKYERYKSIDPFPSIEPALLNSADIMNYVAATGMIYPFNESEETLKPASYRVDALGTCLYWDKNGEKKQFSLEKGEPLTLAPNSIVFVGVEPTFRLPDYIALRFNLQITHVYKGLLVGTGPLVDPGFVGRLWLPLHNLTANSYTIKGGEAIIWMEFTKISSIVATSNDLDLVEKGGTFEKFPARKTWNDIDYYIDKAGCRDRKIQSSISDAIENAKENAQRSAYEATAAKEKAYEIASGFSTHKVELTAEIDKLKAQALFIPPLLSAVIPILLLFITYYNIVYPINSLVTTTTDRVTEWGNRHSALEEKLKRMQEEVDMIRVSQKSVTDNGNTSSIASTPQNAIEQGGELARGSIDRATSALSAELDRKLSKTESDLKSLDNKLFYNVLTLAISLGALLLSLSWLHYQSMSQLLNDVNKLKNGAPAPSGKAADSIIETVASSTAVTELAVADHATVTSGTTEALTNDIRDPAPAEVQEPDGAGSSAGDSAQTPSTEPAAEQKGMPSGGEEKEEKNNVDAT